MTRRPGDKERVSIAPCLPLSHYLRLAQVFDVLSYYDDHQDEIEHYIALNRVPVND